VQSLDQHAFLREIAGVSIAHGARARAGEVTPAQCGTRVSIDYTAKIMSDERVPPEQKQTFRDALYHALRDGPETIRELSIRIGAREKDLLHHLEHLERSLTHTGEKLVVEPARCVACSYAFEDRTRLGKPGRCPACKSTRITLPKFSIQAD
jgi:predicted Zn-ribbon and HTH transcriptional regulator